MPWPRNLCALRGAARNSPRLSLRAIPQISTERRRFFHARQQTSNAVHKCPGLSSLSSYPDHRDRGNQLPPPTHTGPCRSGDDELPSVSKKQAPLPISNCSRMEQLNDTSPSLAEPLFLFEAGLRGGYESAQGFPDRKAHNSWRSLTLPAVRGLRSAPGQRAFKGIKGVR